MALLDDLVLQALSETRVVTNAPTLAPGEPLRVDVIPGGTPLASVVSGLTSPLLADLSLRVTYTLKRGAMDITATTPRAPQPPMPYQVPNGTPMPATLPATELLSVAFLLPPMIRTHPAALPPLLVPPGLPAPLVPPIGLPLDGTLTVSLSLVVDVGGAAPVPKISRDVVIPFTFPVVDLPVIPPALCLLCPETDLTGKYSALLLAPGSGSDVGQALSTVNQIVELLGQLTGLVEKVGVLITPLQKLLTKLSALPSPPQTSNAARVDLDEDFSEYDDLVDTGLDNSMSSYLVIGPTGTKLRLGQDDDDDPSQDITLLDVLELPDTDEGKYLLTQLGPTPMGIAAADVTAAATVLAPLLGGAKLGIGVAACMDLGTSKPHDENFRLYSNGDSMDNDLGRVTWRLAPTI